MSDYQQFKLHDVEIDKGKDTLTASVPKHEIRVLQAVHGPDKVRDMGVPADADDIRLDISADAEIDRLTRRYKRINAPDPVRIAYPMGAEALQSFGFELGRGAVEAAPMSQAKKHKKVEPVEDAPAEPAKAAKAK